MFRQSPRRNGRNKGLKIKHVLQISVLLGASIWLLYQVHHTDAKKPLAITNISNKLHNQSTNDMVKLGRKDLRPRVKETNDQDKKTLEHRTDEEVDESEAEELVQDHDTQDIKHKGVGEIENAGGGEESKEDGMGKNTEKINVEMQGHEKENEDKGRQRSGVKDEITKTEGEREREGMKRSQHEGKDEATKEVNGKEQGTKGSGMGEKGNTKENLKESTSEGSKNESRDRKEGVQEVRKSDNKEEGDVKQSEDERERKDDKQSEEVKGQVNQNMSNKQNKVVVVEKEEGAENEGGNLNPKEIEISSPSEDNVSSDSRMNENRGENGTGEDGTSSSKGPSMDKSDSGSNSSLSQKNTSDEISNVPRASSEKKGQGDAISTIKSYRNRKIGKQTAEQINKKASPDTYLVPAFEHKAAVSVNSTGNQKNGESNQNEAKNESDLSNKNGPKEDIPQEKDAQVTLPRGSRKHENAAAAQ